MVAPSSDGPDAALQTASTSAPAVGEPVQISRTWEQMDLARQAGADRLWVVNVGDLKPMEVPIDFFLDQAWDPAEMTVERMAGWARDWARDQFGEAHAEEIAAFTAFAEAEGWDGL